MGMVLGASLLSNEYINEIDDRPVYGPKANIQTAIAHMLNGLSLRRLPQEVNWRKQRELLENDTYISFAYPFGQHYIL